MPFCIIPLLGSCLTKSESTYKLTVYRIQPVPTYAHSPRLKAFAKLPKGHGRSCLLQPEGWGLVSLPHLDRRCDIQGSPHRLRPPYTARVRRSFSNVSPPLGLFRWKALRQSFLSLASRGGLVPPARAMGSEPCALCLMVPPGLSLSASSTLRIPLWDWRKQDAGSGSPQHVNRPTTLPNGDSADSFNVDGHPVVC
ncbi:hypothetical protein N658DRAFT_176129 [Parathielavia hyrcaniae]|uniref:Uncharacterized protein n=1 Tax=Parathielavia hyrcaniae TaxID=113614 RepID=A0AAN6Q6C3_9PEZI|nr:hypothetical protein N658DRAFT_176129 [Parathielavia hyrcaniae]